MGKLKLTPLKKRSSYRKLAMGSWGGPSDPTVYSMLEVNMEETLKALEEYQKTSPLKITPTHLMARAMAYAFGNRPEINAIIRGRKIFYRDNVRVFFQVHVPGEGKGGAKNSSLSGMGIDNSEELLPIDFAEKIQERIDAIRNKTDKELKSSFDLFKLIPWWASRFALKSLSFLTYGLNLNLSWLGIPKDPFGSVMITNIGSLGIDSALAPLVGISRVPMVITVGKIKQRPWVEGDKVVPKPILKIGVSFDHRLIDGSHAAQMAKDLELCFREPEKYLFSHPKK